MLAHQKHAVYCSMPDRWVSSSWQHIGGPLLYHHCKVTGFSFAAALQQGRIKGVALDVTWTEPLPKDSPLWDLDNLLLSPHCAVRTSDVHQQGHQVFCNLAKLYVAGKPLYNIVDVEAGY